MHERSKTCNVRPTDWRVKRHDEKKDRQTDRNEMEGVDEKFR